MSLFLDQKYLSLISNRLLLFKKKGDFLYNCRCPICGDSQKHRRKARGYFHRYKNELRYKCHNCNASVTFSNFLRTFDSNMFSSYALEKFIENKPLTAEVNEVKSKFEEPKFLPPEERLLDKLLDRVDTLPRDHEVVKFCESRMIPTTQYHKLYFIDNIKDMVQLNQRYKESIITEEPRLVMPCFDFNGQLSGVTCRAIRGEALRYITVKVKEDTPLIFGTDYVDRNKDIYVLEGPIDSLFVENSIAVISTAFTKIASLNLPKERIVMVIDNQPRNKEICKILQNLINLEYRVVIWPQVLKEKDVNEMVQAGKDVKTIIRKNTYSGLEAQAKYIAWKRV